MPKFTPANLRERNSIVKSQKIFWDFLDMNKINKLIHLFDKDVRDTVKNKSLAQRS